MLDFIYSKNNLVCKLFSVQKAKGFIAVKMNHSFIVYGAVPGVLIVIAGLDRPIMISTIY